MMIVKISKDLIINERWHDEFYQYTLMAHSRSKPAHFKWNKNKIALHKYECIQCTAVGVVRNKVA